jgi:hypothetical protein
MGSSPLGQRRFKLVRNVKDGRVIAGFPMSAFNLLIDIDHKPLYSQQRVMLKH